MLNIQTKQNKSKPNSLQQLMSDSMIQRQLRERAHCAEWKRSTGVPASRACISMRARVRRRCHNCVPRTNQRAEAHGGAQWDLKPPQTLASLMHQSTHKASQNLYAGPAPCDAAVCVCESARVRYICAPRHRSVSNPLPIHGE